MVDERTRMVAVTHISNTLGTVNPIADIIDIAHSSGAPVLIDAAQSAAFYPLEVEKNGIDFLAFSGHKIFGPFGTGILYVNDQYRKEMTPFSVGGGMIKQVTVDKTEFQEFPFNLESGTPNVAGFIGLKEAVNYLMNLDRESIREEMYAISDEVRKRLNDMEKISVLGPMDHVSSIISFNVEGVHPHDAATFLNAEGIAVRAGMHCTQPLLSSLELPGTIRASFSMYNTKEEGEKLVEAVEKMCEFWV
jgi:cysteine desulfurase/selenocysteine lyase